MAPSIDETNEGIGKQTHEILESADISIIEDHDIEIKADEEVAMDKYGFIFDSERDYHKGKEDSAKVKKKKNLIEFSREKKWIKMLKSWDFVLEERKEKLHRRVRKGIPDSIRGIAWPRILQQFAYTDEIIQNHQTHRELYRHVSTSGALADSRLPAQTIDEIERDVDRTFPNHIMFRSTGGSAQASLRRVLRWYAGVDPEVGYCQGMGFLVGLFLTYMPEEEAFFCLAAVLQHRLGPVRKLYLPGLVDVRVKLYVFSGLGHQLLERVFRQLASQQIDPTMSALLPILPTIL